MQRVFEVKVYREDDYGLYHMRADTDVQARAAAVELDDIARMAEAERETGITQTQAASPIEYCEVRLLVVLDN